MPSIEPAMTGRQCSHLAFVTAIRFPHRGATGVPNAAARFGAIQVGLSQLDSTC
jgi:hypothetical protein